MPFVPDESQSSFAAMDKEEWLAGIRRGLVPEKPLQEQHPDVPRTLLKFTYQSPKVTEKYLEAQGFEHHRLPSGRNWAIRKPGEPEWRMIDPPQTELKDFTTDILGDVMSAFGTGVGMVAGAPGGPAGMAAGGAGGAAGTQVLKDTAAALMGLKQPIGDVGANVVLEGALGATGPFVDKAARAVGRPIGRAVKGVFGGGGKTTATGYTAQELMDLPEAAVRQKAKEAGLPGAEQYTPDELRKVLLERPSLTDDQLAREMDFLKGEYLEGRFQPKRGTESGEVFIPSKLQRELAKERGAPRPRTPGEGIEPRPGREAEVYKRILGEYKDAQSRAGLRRIDPEELASLGPEGLTRFARARGVPTQAPVQELRKSLFQLSGKPKIAAWGASTLSQVSRSLMAPSEKIKAGVHRFLAGRGAGHTFDQVQQLRQQSARAINAYLDDVIGAADLDKMDDKGRNVLRKLMETRDELARTPTKTISGKEVDNFYQAVLTVKKADPSYNLGFYTENTPNQLRKTLKGEYQAPPLREINADEGGGFGFYALAMKDPALAGGIAGLWMPDPLRIPLLAVGGGGVMGKLGRRLATKLANSADPLHLVLNSPQASSKTRALAQAAIDKFNRGDTAGYRAAIYVLLSKSAVRNILEGEPEEDASYP